MNHPTDRFTKSEDDGELWLTAAEIGEALGYAQPNQAISKLFREHKDDFSNDINLIVDTTIRVNLLGDSIRVKANPPNRERIFNLEGIALICMFSEQPIAKEFRNPGPVLRSDGNV